MSAGILAAQPFPALSRERRVPLPDLTDGAIAPRVLYLENSRFPAVTRQELRRVLRAAARLVQAHFGVSMRLPERIAVHPIDAAFHDLVENAPFRMKRMIGDFRNGRVDWQRVEDSLIAQIAKQQDPLEEQIAFARPYLLHPLEREDRASFARAVVETFRARLSHWTRARLPDGHPVIGRVPGRPDLPLNEYLYWSLMAKRGVEAEIVLTNQLVASVEYVSLPVHSSIRGGISGGATEYNPASAFGSSVWVSLFPYLSDDPQIRALRGGARYSREQAFDYAGAMLAHEMGHQLLHLGHPWSNPACPMRPAEALDFAAWVGKFDAEKCPVGSSPAMRPGAIAIPVW